MVDVLREYLVDLGFNVNGNEFNKFKGALSDAERAYGKFSSSTSSKLAGASAAIVTFIGAIDVAVAKMLGGLAKTDLEMQMFARMMWTSKENAMAFKNTLDAMGVSMEDLYVSPELMQKFIELRNQSLTMGPPSEEYAEQMKSLRQFSYEFSRLKLTATYALQWIGYYLMKYLQKPLDQLEKWFKDINDKLIQTMPQWTQKVAQFASWFFRLAEVIIKLPDSVKMLVLAFTGWNTTLALIKSPLTWIIAGLTTLLLLLDDYQTFMEGGDSLFGDFWKSFDAETMSNNFKTIGDNFVSFIRAMVDLAVAITNLGDTLAKLMGFKDMLDLIGKTGSNSLTIGATGTGLATGGTQFLTGLVTGNKDLMQQGADTSRQAVKNLERLQGKNGEFLGQQLASGTSITDLLSGGENFFNYGKANNTWLYQLDKAREQMNEYLWGWAGYKMPSQYNNTFNIQSTDPKQAASEVQYYLRTQGGY